MEKRRILHISFWILTVLLFCTVVSFRIRELMTNEVTVIFPEKTDDGYGCILPTGCMSVGKDGLEGIWELVEEEGAMGMELRVRFRVPNVLSQDEDVTLIADEGVDNLGIVDYAAYPLEDGMRVEKIAEKPDGQKIKSQMESQKKYLYLFGASAAAFVVLACISDRLLNGIFQKKIQKAVLGVAIVLAAAAFVYYAAGRIDIPRECLPEEQIFDVSFYKERFF